jgi:predicted CopG family antitoxin
LTQGEPRKISVSDELYKRLSELLPESGTTSIDELVSRILRDWVSKEGATTAERKRISKSDEKVVEDRLKALGYL